MKALKEAQKQYWYDNNFDKSDNHLSHQIALNNFEDGWKAALDWVSKLCPTNENATFANQGQGMDGYTELANYKTMYKKLKEELNGTA